MDTYEENGCLHEMFIRQAKKTPDAVAIVFEDSQLTYRELDRTTDDLSSWLRVKGVKVNSTVGIYMERCINYTVAYIAILKAGGGYMPMDPSYPTSLLQDIIDDAKPAAVITQADLASHLPETKNVLVCSDGWLDRVKEGIKDTSLVGTPVKVGLDDLAYTVYSSGTTGRPKGIQCPHRGAVFSYLWRSINYPYKENEREACNVFFVWEMLRPLLCGATLYIVPDSTIYDPRVLCQFLLKNEITRMLFTPSLFEAVLDAPGIDVAAACKHLRTLTFCGEVVTVSLLERCMATLPWVQFANLYSISESHDVACADLTQWYHSMQGELQNKKFCPVGKLLPGVHVLILDDDLVPQPVGVPGEIYIGGPTLAWGYLNRPELNAQRFIPRPPGVPEAVGSRLYKAGDWGYVLSDGSFEICGRCDSMVKIRGYSIETQAVEKALLDLSGYVNACVVAVIGKEGEDKKLVAYVVPEGPTTKKTIRAALKKRLPFYMIPSYFVFLKSIPILAASGKLDKKALPPLDCDTEDQDQEGRPTTETEIKLEKIWAEVLHLKEVDIQESFFDLGGHSLLATKLLTEVRDDFGIDLAVKDLFTYSTVAAMAKLIDQQINNRRASIDIRLPKLDLSTEVENHDQAVVDMDIKLRAFWRSVKYKNKWQHGRVLLTGATGFLGSFMLRDLLLHTKSHIFCIVRELPDKKSYDRVKASLVQYGILDPDSEASPEDKMGAMLRSRVSVYAGDVGLMRMGLSQDDYMYLCTEIDYIIHVAAHVNLIYPYQALYRPNVLGTQNVLRFACSRKIKPVHYISTNAVFPHGRADCGENEDMLQFHSQLSDGYSQSKWVAEQLVRRGMDRGLPATIYRLGNLSGDSKHAHWNSEDFNLLMLQSLARSGLAPDVDWDVEMTPVDFVSNLVVTLAQTMSDLGKIFHVVNNKPLKAKWLYDWMTGHGYMVEVLPFDQWTQKIQPQNELAEKDLLSKLLDSLVVDSDFFSQLSTYRQDELSRVLDTLGLTYPKLDSQLLHTYFHHLAQRKIIPKHRTNTLVSRPLEGRVAIVTGASSGIGAAVCQHLAQAGAKVAMAARREEQLEALKATIVNEGGVAVAIKCDVTSREQVQAMIERTECTLGPVDILVNNAGVMYYTFMKNLQEDQWQKQIDVNCKGVMNCIGATLDGLIQRGHGHIVNMSSDAGRKGFPGLAVYSGTKYFIEGMSQALRQEVAKTGVKVTCIQPGNVRTELVSHTTDLEAKSEFLEGSTATVLEPDDIGRAVVYATSQPPYTAVNEILIEPREEPI